MKILLITLFLFGSSFLQAQISPYSISAKIQYAGYENSSLKKFSSYFQDTKLNDSLAIRTFSEAVSIFTYEHTPKFGFDLMLNARFDLSKRFKIKTGLGLNYFNFNLYGNYSSFTSSVVGKDTIQKVILDPTNSGGNSNACTSFTNTYLDIDELRNGEDYNILSLRIPLMLELVVFPEKINIGLGTFIQTPLYSREVDDILRINREQQSNGNVICEYYKETTTDKTGYNLNNLQMGINGNFNYFIRPNLGFEIGVSKEFRNIFVPSISTYNPLKISIGIEYRINVIKKKIRKNEINLDN